MGSLRWLLLVAVAVATADRESVEKEILLRRGKLQAATSASTSTGAAAGSATATAAAAATAYSPSLEPFAGPRCELQGLVVRREMGNLGVSSFQHMVAYLIADALGYRYYDDWPQQTGFLRVEPNVTIVDKDRADSFRARCGIKVSAPDGPRRRAHL